MSEDKAKKTEEIKNTSPRRDSSRSSNQRKKSADEFDKRIVSIRRVSRTYKGGKRMRLSVMVVAGDKKGRVGVGTGKGADVKTAEAKAIAAAKKNMIKINLKGVTISHEVVEKYKAAKIVIRPASPGTGVIAGGGVRPVLEMVGIKDALAKQLGSSNSMTNVYATLSALKKLK